MFAEGRPSFLSDHFAVMALLDVDPEHGRRDHSDTLVRHRRAALARLRDQAAFLERRGNDEASRVGRVCARGLELTSWWSLVGSTYGAGLS